jgi:hypothetical protein
MSHEGYHKPVGKLSDEICDHHRAIVPLILLNEAERALSFVQAVIGQETAVFQEGPVMAESIELNEQEGHSLPTAGAFQAGVTYA